MAELLALEWDKYFIRAVEATASGAELRLRKSIEIPRPPEWDAPALQSWLTNLVGELGIRARQAVVVLPRSFIAARRLEVPDVSDAELPDLVRFQAAARMSQSLNELHLDFLPIPKREGAANREVLSTSISASQMTEIREIVEGAGLELAAVGVSPVAAAEISFRAQPPEETGGTTLILVRSGDRVEMTVCEGPLMIYTHTTQLDPDEEERHPQMIVSELSRALVALRSLHPNFKLDRIHLLGTAAEFRGLDDLLRSRFNAPVVHVDPLAFVRLANDKVLPETASHSALAGLVGGLLAQVDARVPTLDFLNPRKPPVRPDERRRKLVVYGSAASLFVVGLIGAYWLRISTLDARIADLNSQKARIEGNLEDGKPFQANHKAIAAWMKSSPIWSDELIELHRLMPETDRLYLTDLRVAPSATKVPPKIKIGGYARTQADIFQWRDKVMAESTRLRVLPSNPEPSSKDQYYPWRFDVELVVGAAGAEKKAAGRSAPARRGAAGKSEEAGPSA